MILFYGKWRVSDGVVALAKSLNIPVETRDDADVDLDLSRYDAIIPTPGVSPENRVYTSDRILAEMDFAARYLPKGFKTICITGTDGKSTTAWILYKLLVAEHGEDRVFLSGNFEIPFSQTVRQIRERGLKTGYIVIEVSSFMAYNLSRPSALSTLTSLPKGAREGGFHPDYSIFTNFETDHLNWHSDLQDYFNAKMRVFELTTKSAIINEQVFRKAENLGLIVPKLENVRVFGEVKNEYSEKGEWNRHRERSVAILHEDQAGSKIATSQSSSQWQKFSNLLQNKEEDPESSSGWRNIYKDRIEYPNIVISGRRKYSMDETNFSGGHNAMNILSVTLVTNAMKICSKRTREYLRNISGLAHRLEFVTEKRGIRFIDDSKSTSAQSLIAAIESFKSPHPNPLPEGEGINGIIDKIPPTPLYQGGNTMIPPLPLGEGLGVRAKVLLIAGGSDKGDAFEGVGKTMQWIVKHVELIGATREQLARICTEYGISHHIAESMDEAVQENMKRAVSGDTVLLSPGCASFGMFRDYLDRAEKFREAVKSL